MIVRDANAVDLVGIDRVFRTSFCDTFAHLYDPKDLAMFLGKFTPEAWASEFADPRYSFRVAEADGDIVGYVKLGPLVLPVDTQADAVELRQLYILKGYHGVGLAHRLMDWAIEESRRRGCGEIYLSVYTENLRARRFYDRYGFETVGPYHFMVGSQADEDLIMRKKL